MHYRRLVTLTGIIFAILIGAIPMVSAQDNSETPARDSVAVTVYNEGTALVQDRRTFSLNEGMNFIDFRDVASSIDPTSVNFKSLTDPTGTTVLEQNYVYDLVGTQALLRRYIDQAIVVTSTDGTTYQGDLLAASGGDIILRNDAGEVSVVSATSVQDIQFPELPDGLITRPTLRWLINAAATSENQVELTYLTGGISWTADYNVLLARGNGALDLNGWVTLNNNSGTTYADAQVKLVAGDINRVQEQRLVREELQMDMMAQSAAPNVEQREFFEYQLYEIGRPVTIGNNETKQVEFVSGTNVPATTFFVYDGSPQFFGYGTFYTEQFYGQTGITDVQNFLEFTTDAEDGLGADLPAGRIRVYQEDVDGAALLIGENRIDHTPEGETVQIYLGNAFDLVGERTQTNFNQISRDVVEETFEIRLRNRKDSDAVEIRVPERMTRGNNWEIISSTHDFTRLNAFAIEFRPEVQAGEEVVITYTVRYTRR